MKKDSHLVSPLDRVLFLRTLPALQGLSPLHLAAIAGHATERFFDKGRTVLGADQPADELHIIVEGLASTVRYRPESELLGPGEMIGFLHLFAGAERAGNAWAETDLLTLELDWSAQLAACEEHFPILLSYLRYLARRSIQVFRRFPLDRSFGLDPGQFAPADRDLDLVERTMALRRARPFVHASADALWELAHHVQPVLLERGATVWRTHDPSDHLYVIAAGSLLCPVDTDTAPFEMGPGSVPGLEEALAGEPRWYDARVSEPVRALRVDVEPLLDVFEDHFRLALQVTSDMAQRLIDLLEAHAGAAQDHPGAE